MAKTVRLTAATLASLFVVAFQLQLLPFFLPLFIDDRIFWPVVYYGCGSFTAVITLAILATQRSILRQSVPILAVCAFAIGLTLTHPLDGISKNLIVAMIFVACATVLAIASAPFALLRFSASATVLSAIICLLDILFRNGFTNSVGRAAGLSINANVAAAGLLLGAASSYWTIPPCFRGPFVLIVGAAIFVTLSKSTQLAAIAICAGVGADLIWTRVRSPGAHLRIRWVRSGVLVLGLAGWIVAALFSNDRFSVAATDSFQGIGTALKAFREARQSINSAIESRAPPPRSSTPAGAPSARSSTPVDDAAQRKSESDDRIKEIGIRAETEGDINSISARGLLMERAFLSYQNGPFLGQGLAAAHALQPHNTFLLFAVAFGDIGWIVPLAFLGLTACWARSIRQMPLFLATFVVMATSHDILLTPGLLAPIVLGIAALNSRRYGAGDPPYLFSAMSYSALTAPILFALGGAFIAGVGISRAQAPPALLLLLVFIAITLWSGGVWLWTEKLMR
jgi:hypothetical protein